MSLNGSEWINESYTDNGEEEEILFFNDNGEEEAKLLISKELKEKREKVKSILSARLDELKKVIDDTPQNLFFDIYSEHIENFFNIFLNICETNESSLFKKKCLLFFWDLKSKLNESFDDKIRDYFISELKSSKFFSWCKVKTKGIFFIEEELKEIEKFARKIKLSFLRYEKNYNTPFNNFNKQIRETYIPVKYILKEKDGKQIRVPEKKSNKRKEKDIIVKKNLLIFFNINNLSLSYSNLNSFFIKELLRI